jgi:hypothetical protein
VAYEEVKNPEHPPTDGLCPECFRYMLIKSVYDLTGAFGMGGGNHLGTVAQ